MTKVVKGHNLAELIEDTLAAQQTTALPGEIHEPQDIPVAE